MREDTPTRALQRRSGWQQPVSIGILALTLAACGGTRENDQATLSQGSLDLAFEQLTDTTLVAGATRMATETETLNRHISSFCASPDAAGLTQAQGQWRTLASAWQQLLPYNFGPLNDDLVFPTFQNIDSYRPRGRDYTETVRTEIDDLLVSGDVLSADYFASRNFNRVGLLALEVALFETAAEQDTDATAVLNEFVAQTRKCELLTGLGGALERQTDKVRDGWTVTYKDTGKSYRTQFLSGELDDGSTSLVALLTSVQSYLDYLQQRDVVSNVARISASDSFDSWTLMTASINSISDLLEGTTDEQVSLFELMISGGNATAVETVRANLQQARDAIANRDTTSFNASAATLDGNFKRDIPDSLDVSLGINFSDGD